MALALQGIEGIGCAEQQVAANFSIVTIATFISSVAISALQISSQSGSQQSSAAVNTISPQNTSAVEPIGITAKAANILLFTSIVFSMGSAFQTLVIMYLRKPVAWLVPTINIFLSTNHRFIDEFQGMRELL